MKVGVCGTGRALPARRVTSTALDHHLGTGDLVEATGVHARYVCEHETQIDLAVSAAHTAIKNANVTLQEIDLIVAGASVPFQPIPATAPLIMGRLGIKDGAASAFDVNSTCLGFVTALETAARMIEGGSAHRALVVSSEVASRALPWNSQPDVAALFGDGAAAAVLLPGSTGALIAFHARTYPSAYSACGIGAGGTRFDFQRDATAFAAHTQFEMNGRELFRIATQHFNRFVEELLTKANWAHSEVDWVVPHQASPGALNHLIKQTGFASDRVVRVVEDVGNQIAASIPFALDVARRDGRITPGDRVLLLGTSAGVSFGGAALVA